MKPLLLLTMLPLLLSCVSNGVVFGVNEDTPHITQHVVKVFIGIPTLFGLEGSMVNIGNGFYLTAKHNYPILEAQLLDVVYHPTCDIAIIKTDNLSNHILKLGLVYQDTTVHTAGYPIAAPLSSSNGVFIGDIYEAKGECLYSATDAPVRSGMSGGGVFNEQGELVGIIRGVMYGEVMWNDGRLAKDITIFTTLKFVEDWIFEHTHLRVE